MQTLYHADDISLYSNAFGFLRAPLCFEPDKSDADVIITGVPFDAATSWPSRLPLRRSGNPSGVGKPGMGTQALSVDFCSEGSSQDR